jgi:hypothetical protein
MFGLMSMTFFLSICKNSFSIDSASGEIVSAFAQCAIKPFLQAAAKSFVQNQYKPNNNGIFDYKEYKNKHLTKILVKKTCNKIVDVRLLGQRGNFQKPKILTKSKGKDRKFFE